MKHHDVAARLRELSAEYELPAEAGDQLAAVLRELEHESASITTVRDPAEGVERHVEDSLTALAVPAVRAAARIADLGAGGGFPGFGLAAALPGSHVCLVESVERKCAFLERAATAAGFANAEVVCDRAESWAAGRGAMDVVTARALASLPVLLEYAAPLLRVGGTLVAWKGRAERGEIAAGEAAAAMLGMSSHAVVDLSPRRGAAGGGDRSLYVYVKLAPTPDRFPRRVGVARKRPLA